MVNLIKIYCKKKLNLGKFSFLKKISIKIRDNFTKIKKKNKNLLKKICKKI